MKILLLSFIAFRAFSFEGHLYNNSLVNGASKTTGIFQNEKYNYHFKCGYNPLLNKNSFASFENLSTYSSRVSNEPAVSFMTANGLVRYFYTDINKVGSDRIKFKIGSDTFYGKAGSSGWFVSRNVQPDNYTYKEIELGIAEDYQEQALHYEEQLGIALNKYATTKAKNTENSLSNEQLINCSKLSAKSENKTFKTALSTITDIETKESYREIASEIKKYEDNFGGSEGGTTGGTSNTTR